ncbi:MAG: DUF2793 domain-containing protein [Alphaproteobacteria bacterium]|nr:MAG: DUF2793 domain-containing protein [Alphaproteobacteria bacterium]TAF41472.1 MAG: DUF2793 domain-containing protein [Alphaproteobacteria bacterium]TAF75722.1 MAG: DUF2793 domain-containing protein [Alphaproteobacteria bacterium]
MTTTPHLGLTYIEQAQAQKEVTANEAFARIDAVLHHGIISHNQQTPPASPQNGDVYILGASPTGAWAGYAHHLAYYDQIWRFIPPRIGATYWVHSEKSFFVYHNAIWQRATYGTMAVSERSLFIPAPLMHPASTNGCAALATHTLGSNKPELRTLDFDASAIEYAYASAQLPQWAGGTVHCSVLWSHNGTAGGNVVWSIEAHSARDNISLDTTLSSAIYVTDTALNAQHMHETGVSSPITPSGNVSAGAAHLSLRIGRNASDSADNFASDARLHGIYVHYSSVGV